MARRAFPIIVRTAFCALLALPAVCSAQLVPVEPRGESKPVSSETADELFSLAASDYANEQWAAAIHNFQRLVEKHPNDERAASASFYIGESRIQTGEYAEAEAAFRDYLNRAPENELVPRAAFRIAESQYLRGDRDKALGAFDEFLKSHRDDPLAEFALPYLAELQFDADKTTEARENYEEALRRFPDASISDKCRIGLARTLQRLGELYEADRFYSFVADKPESDLADGALLMSARMWASNEDWNACRQRVAQLETCFPDSELRPQATYLAAKATMADSDWEAAWKLIEPLLDAPWRGELFAPVALDAALVAIRLNQFARAGELVARARRSTDDPAMLECADALEIDVANEQTTLDGMESLVNRYEAERPDSPWLPRAIELLARRLYTSGEYARAAPRYGQLVTMAGRIPDLQPHVAAWRYLHGLALIGMGDYGSATRELREIDSFDGDRTFEGAAAFALATSLAGSGMFDVAIPNYRKYLDLVPDGDDAIRCHADLATALVRNDELDAAVEVLAKVAFEYGNDRSVLAASEFIAEAALRDERPELAQTWFRILADSGHEDFARRGATGSIWSGDEESIERPLVEKMLQQGDDASLEALMARAVKLQAAKQYAESRLLFEKIVASAPQGEFAGSARVRLAITLHRQGGNANAAEAKRLLEQFVAEVPNHPLRDVAWYELAWMRQEAGESEAAREAFQAIASEFSDSQYWCDSLYRAATLSRELNDPESAQQDLSRLIESRPEDRLVPFARYALGEMAAGRQDWTKSIEQFELVRKSTTASELAQPALFWIAECYYQKGHTAFAERHFQSLRDVHFDDSGTESTVALRLAQCSARRDDWNSVGEILQWAESNNRIGNDRYQFDYLRARVLSSEAKFEQARELLHKVLGDPAAQGTPTAAMSQWLIGESWFHQEDYQSALRAYLLVDTLYDFPQWRALALLQAAKCHEHLENRESAIRTLERLQTTFPESGVVIDARRYLVRLRGETGRTGTQNAKYSQQDP